MVCSVLMTEENTQDTQDAVVYELGYHVLPTVPADALESEVATIRSAIEKHGGNFIAEGTPEMMTLAYPMYVNNGGKNTTYTQAYFGWMKFELTPEAVAALKEAYTANAQILRFTIFKTVKEETRAQMQVADAGVLREVETRGTIEKRQTDVTQEKQEKGEVSEEAIDKSIDELVAAPEK